MSDKPIPQPEQERYLLDSIHDMCVESLPPELFKKWEEVRIALIENRSNLKQ